MNSQSLVSKKTKGRPIGSQTTGIGTPIMLRVHADLLTALDAEIELSEEKLTRPEAIRRILRDVLKAKGYDLV